MVQRYDLVGDMDGNCNLNEARMDKSDDGVYVKYKDYADLHAVMCLLTDQVNLSELPDSLYEKLEAMGLL